MDYRKAAVLANGTLSITQTAGWVRPLADGGDFKDSVLVRVVGPDGSHEETVVSLDDLVDFVVAVRAEWRASRDMGAMRRVAS